MKWIEANPRIRYIRLRRPGKRGTKVLFGTAVETCLDEGVNNGVSGTTNGKSQTEKPGALLVQEMTETNNWARLLLQVYFGWFALQATINGVALGWLFSYNGPMQWFSKLIFLMFIGSDLFSGIGTILVYKSLVTCDTRIDELIDAFTRHQAQWLKSRSPIPRSALTVVFTFCAASCFVLLIFWLVLFIGGR